MGRGVGKDEVKSIHIVRIKGAEDWFWGCSGYDIRDKAEMISGDCFVESRRAID